MIRTRAEFEARAAAGLSFAGETIEGVDLDGFEADGVDFGGSVWANVRARGAKLTTSIWSNARLTLCDFHGADLTGAVAMKLDASSPPGMGI